MDSDQDLFRIVKPDERLLMVVGGYGSGKTEVSVNLALRLAAAGARVQIADLDLVNPYFRCREARRLMEHHGIRVVVPPGAQAWADLPILLPEVQGMIDPPEGTISIFDVGGDDVGATALASLRPRILDGHYQLWQVVNSKRPFTGTVDGCIAMQQMIERASRLSVTGLLANSHLVDETTPADVLEGWTLSREISVRTGLPVRALSVMGELAESPEIAPLKIPKLRLERYMLPPWLQHDDTNDEAPLPAGRPVPIGRPAPLNPRGPKKTGRRKGDDDGSHLH